MGAKPFALRIMEYTGPLVGYELTHDAVQAAREIAKHFNVQDIPFHQADLIQDRLNLKGALVYSYHCLEQIKYHTEEVIGNLIAAEPAIVVHFEPLPEVFKLYRPRDFFNFIYNKIADYQSSLYTTLKEKKRLVEVKDLSLERQGYYQLPIQETICVAWKPN